MSQTQTPPSKLTLEPAYVAGIVDGEGHIGLKKQWKNRSYYLRMNIYSSSYSFLEILKTNLGGAIHRKSTKKNDFMIEFSCAAAERLFWLTDPFIILKKRQYDLAKEFLKVKNNSVHRKYNPYTDDELELFHWVHNEISRVNKLSHRPDPDVDFE